MIVTLHSMVSWEFFGCLGVAYGVPIALFFSLCIRQAQLVVVMLAAATSLLIALLASGLVWYILSPLRGQTMLFMPLLVIAIEVVRYYFFRLYCRIERQFGAVATNAVSYPLSDFYSSLAAGVGFGAAYTLAIYASIFAEATGPGVVFSATCPYMSTFVFSAWHACLLNIAHVALSVISFDAWQRRYWPKLTVLWMLHFVVACSPLLLSTSHGCALALLLAVIATGASIFYAIYVTGAREYLANKARSPTTQRRL